MKRLLFQQMLASAEVPAEEEKTTSDSEDKQDEPNDSKVESTDEKLEEVKSEE